MSFLPAVPIRWRDLPAYERRTHAGQAFNLVDYSPQISELVNRNVVTDFAARLKHYWNSDLGQQMYLGVDYNAEAKRDNIRKRARDRARERLEHILGGESVTDAFLEDLLLYNNVDDFLALKYSPDELSNPSRQLLHDRFLVKDILEQFNNYVDTELRKLEQGGDINMNFQIISNPVGNTGLTNLNIEWAFLFENMEQLDEFQHKFFHYMNQIYVEGRDLNRSFEIHTVQFRIYSIPTANYVAIDPFVLATRSAIGVSPVFTNKYDAARWLETLFAWADRWMNLDNRELFDAGDMDWMIGSYARVNALYEMIENMGRFREEFYRSYVLLTSVTATVNIEMIATGGIEADIIDAIADDYGHDEPPPRVRQIQRKALRTQQDLLDYFRRIHNAPSYRHQLYEREHQDYLRRINEPGPSNRVDPVAPVPPPPIRRRQLPARYRE